MNIWISSTQDYLNGEFGEGRWDRKEYLEFVGSPKWTELKNANLASSAVTSQFDRWSDKLLAGGGIKTVGGKRLKFAMQNMVEKMTNKTWKKMAYGLAAGTGQCYWKFYC